ncbi:unnamed protein product, partial [Prorocentrum cordatum]
QGLEGEGAPPPPTSVPPMAEAGNGSRPPTPKGSEVGWPARQGKAPEDQSPAGRRFSHKSEALSLAARTCAAPKDHPAELQPGTQKPWSPTYAERPRSGGVSRGAVRPPRTPVIWPSDGLRPSSAAGPPHPRGWPAVPPPLRRQCQYLCYCDPVCAS